VDLASKKSETGKNYDTINPKCVVPALLLNNGEILTENAVIMQYLADTSHATQLLPREGDLNRYRVRVVEFCGDGATQRTGVFIQSSSISRNKR
jgi:glutathione S-transferase